jgi:hypothetical protein
VLPKYAIASLELASKHSGLPITLLGNENIRRQLGKTAANFIPIESFYNNDIFTQAAKRIRFPSSFRDGFWLKTLERFFVLSQYMTSHNLSSIFHAELDQLLFGVDQLLSNLGTTTRRGLFIPFHDDRHAIGSIFYCNSNESLKSLLDFVSFGDFFESEMVAIANWAKLNPQQVFRLPTLIDVIGKKSKESKDSNLKKNVLNHTVIKGIVDAAQLGQWVGGIDPRNVPIGAKPQNKFVDKPDIDLLTRDQLQKVKFNFNSDTLNLSVELDKKVRTTLYNLHLHSKIHMYLLRSDPKLARLFSLANQLEPSVFPGTRYKQIRTRTLEFVRLVIERPHTVFVAVRVRFSRLFLRGTRLKNRSSSLPYISGDTFRKASDHVWETGDQSLIADSVRPGDVIFCESDKLDQFIDKVASRIGVTYVLLLGNSDVNHIGSNLRARLGKHATSVYAQNLLEETPGVLPLPIGLENAWHSRNGKVKEFNSVRRLAVQKIHRIMWTFTLDTNLEARRKAAEELGHCGLADQLGHLTPNKHRRALARYGFVASPPGNGLDTHRTWEAMYLRCVPIVLRSAMTEHYERIALPLWVIDSYSELHAMNQSDLKDKYESIANDFENESLWASFWINLIKDDATKKIS